MRLVLGLLLSLTCFASLAQEGRILVTVGVCKESLAQLPILLLRKVDKSAHERVGGPGLLWGSDYEDAVGTFKVSTPKLAAGEWEVYSFELTTNISGVGSTKHRPRAEFSHRFTVAPGKLVDIGRYCGATQSTGEVFEDWPDRTFNHVVKVVYMHVSANRPADVDKARSEGGGALEVQNAAPQSPERVSPLLRTRFVEPRVIRKPAAPKPLDIPR